MRRNVKLALSVLAFVPFLLAISSVNYFFASERTATDKAVEKRIVQNLIKGRGVEFPAEFWNYDDRFLQEEYVRFLDKGKEILVLGSSRAMLITSDLFPGGSFFNTNLSSGVLNDAIAVYGLYRQKGFIPSTVILGVDYWEFDKSMTRGMRKWEGLRASYMYMLDEMHSKVRVPSVNITDYLPESVVDVLSFSSFQRSLQLFRKSYRNSLLNEAAQFMPIENRESEKPTVFADGSRTFGEKDLLKDNATVEAGILKDAKEIQNPGTGIDRNMVDLFNRFLSLLEKDQVEVVFFLAPYHPLLYKIWNGAEEKFGEGRLERVEKLVRDIARERGIKVVGSFNPTLLDMTPELFLDGSHLKRASSVRTLFEKESEGMISREFSRN